MEQNKFIKPLTLITKIFFVWLLLQFFLQTFVTYKLWFDWTIWKIIWMRKEIIIIGLLWFLTRYFWRHRISPKISQKNLPPIASYEDTSYFLYDKNFKGFFARFRLKNFVRVFLATILVSFLVSVLVNHSGIGTWIMSMKYTMIGFLIFIVFFTTSLLFFGTKEINLIKRYTRIMKTLLVGSLIRRGILWLMPNLLKFAWYNQFNYEWDVGIPPPAAYYTQFDSGFARNQFLFERPISRWFFLIALWPLFFVLCFKNKPLRDKIMRWSLYGIAIISTFSRAAWWVWILQSIILVLLQFPKKYRKKSLRWFAPLFLLLGGVIFFGQQQILTRQFSDTGHFRLVVEAINKIGDRPLWWQWAGTAWPASHQVEGINSYNPENQYLQIRIEYGLLWFIWRLYLYGYLHRIAYKAYKEDVSWEMKEKKSDSKITKKRKLYGMIVFAFGVGILGLSIEGVVLQSFVDRMIVYPFMALFAIAYGLYVKEKK